MIRLYCEKTRFPPRSCCTQVCKNRDFRPISCVISETLKDSTVRVSRSTAITDVIVTRAVSTTAEHLVYSGIRR